MALASRAVHAERTGIPENRIATEILPVRHFTYAEAYHQKYYLTRQQDLRAFLDATYPEGKALADSTVATRLNAYLGSGLERDWKVFLEELASHGLPEALEARLQKGLSGLR